MRPSEMILRSFFVWCCIASACTAADAVSDHDRAFFETKIRPVLVQHCYECHSDGADEIGGGLLLDQPNAMRKSGESGGVIMPGDPENSLLIQAIAYVDADLEMPPSGPLGDAVVSNFRKWIKNGAKDPRNEAKDARSLPSANPFDLSQDRHWSFYPVVNPVVPTVADETWPRDPMDHFVMSRAAASGLSPVADASPRDFVQRLYFDLVGLPPSIEVIGEFVKASAAHPNRAKEDLVNDLLGRHDFGERWARHWLDVARYGESNGDDGLGRNATFPHAWRYRDYVIDALNRDLPYDQFLAEQIAGDLLTSKDADQRNRRLVATGFLAIGSKPASAMNKDFPMDIVDDQINVVSTAVMGLSVACARCHDHKHDPISTRDYYAMAGIFTSTETLYGLAGNEKLTAPPTPLHELRSDWKPDGKPPKANHRLKVPKLPEAYAAAIRTLRPTLYEPLNETRQLKQNKALQVDAKLKVGSNYAVAKDTKIHGSLPHGTTDYSVSFWFRNTLKNDSRPITAYLFSRAKMGDKGLPGDHLGIGGTHEKDRTGKIFLFNGNVKNKRSVAGKSVVPVNTWNHVTLSRSNDRIRVVLNGLTEIDEQVPATFGDNTDFCVARRSDRFAPLQGNVGELCLFDRSFSQGEAFRLYDASGLPRAKPPTTFAVAMGVRDKGKVANCKIHVNGSGAKKGPEVPRGYPSVYQQISSQPNPLHKRYAIDAKSSGRLQLARWLTDKDHPQTSRVMVNRVWMHLFGRPIVDSPDDFGVYGATPNHPELLDHLAIRFVDEGWSIKQLIRTIVLSRTYGLSSNSSYDIQRIDPGNRLFMRHSIRRLDAESLRDSILMVTGDLDQSPGQGSDIDTVDQLINWPPGAATHLHKDSQHRSIYLCMLRHDPPDELAAFDLPVGVAVAGRRAETNLPTQSLFLLNSPFVVQQSQRFASTLLAKNVTVQERINTLFETLLRRRPTKDERLSTMQYLNNSRQTFGASGNESSGRESTIWASLVQGLMSTNEFRYID